jgi:predicted AAA+ superfamily ATPase
LDEIQYIKNNERILKALYDDTNIKLKFVVSGSGIWNIKTTTSSLVGRGKEIFVWGFDFFEFLECKGLNVKNFTLTKYSSSLSSIMGAYYEEYLRFGGYPEVVISTTKEEKILALEKIISRYIEKDV